MVSRYVPRTVDELRQALIGTEVEGRPMQSKYDGACAWCEQAILPGDLIVYLPKEKAAVCPSCAIDGQP